MVSLAFVWFLLVACGVVSCRQHTKTEAVFTRAERLLQANSFTIGGYTGTRAPSVKAECSDKGVNTTELNMTEADFNASMNSLTARYQGPRSQLETAFKGQNFANFNVAAAASSTFWDLAIPVFCSVFSIISTVFFLFWGCFEGLWKETRCMKKLEPGEVRITQKLLAGANILVGLGMLGAMTLWGFQVSKSLTSVRYLTCEMATLSSDIVVGVQYPERK